MKVTVLHVYFLVLVVWAVHSHGRVYESQFECLEYTNTQLPYKENMSAETLSPTIGETFDYFYMVLLWPGTYCAWKKVSCQYPVTYRFTVHGLWPQRNNEPPVCCAKANIQLARVGLPWTKLQLIWPNLVWKNNPSLFWIREYVKHGSCFHLSQQEYFGWAVKIMDHFPSLTAEHPENIGIVPGKPYPFGDLLLKIRQVTGFYPRLQCDHGQIHVYQIYLCVNKTTLRLFDCDGWATSINYSCQNTVIIPRVVVREV